MSNVLLNSKSYSIGGIGINAASAPIIPMPGNVKFADGYVEGELNVVTQYDGVTYVLIHNRDSSVAKLLSKHHMKRCEVSNIAARREAADREVREMSSPVRHYVDQRPRQNNRSQFRG